MMPHKYFKKYKSILCLNGDLPDSNFFLQDKIIIAADGAADKLLKIGIRPSIIIGDLDSIERSDYQDIEIIHRPDQSESDFQKAMQYLKEQELLPSIICGVSGGFIDHILQNINIVLENDCVFYSPPVIGYVLNPFSVQNYNFKKNNKISLFGMPKARIKTSGLKWELNNDVLEFPGFNSCSNRTFSKNISIEVIEGKLLMLVYLEQSEDMGEL